MQARTAAGHPVRRRRPAGGYRGPGNGLAGRSHPGGGLRGRPGTKGHSGGAQTAETVGTTVFPLGHRQPTPAVALTGGRLWLSGFRGSVVVLNFWASRCGPCKAEGPVLARLWHAYQSPWTSASSASTSATPRRPRSRSSTATASATRTTGPRSAMQAVAGALLAIQDAARTSAAAAHGGATGARVAQLLGDELPPRRPLPALVTVSPAGLSAAVWLAMCLAKLPSPGPALL